MILRDDLPPTDDGGINLNEKRYGVPKVPTRMSECWSDEGMFESVNLNLIYVEIEEPVEKF